MTKIDWSKWSAIAEIFGAIAIVATLLYLSVQTTYLARQTELLAVQTQQTNSALVASSRQATMTSDVAMITALVSNPEAWTNTHSPIAELTLQEQEQVINVMAGLLRIREFSWFQFQNGTIDEAAFRSYAGPVARWIRRGDIRTIWETRFAQEMDPGFVSYINSLLDESD